MSPQNDEKQFSVRISEYFVDRLDKLAKSGSVNRHHLQLCLIIVWLRVFEDSTLPNYFKVALEIRDLETMITGDMKPTLEYIELKYPGKALPIKLSESDSTMISIFASRTHLNRHLLMKKMILVGIEELEKITENNQYRYADVEPQLFKAIELIMKKGRKAFLAAIK
jgi:hypothetical protein